MHPLAKYKNSAAFYDVDGTLIKINIVHAFAFYAARHASLTESATRTLKTALSIPVFWAADKLSRKWFNEIFYRSYDGASEDRLVVLAESCGPRAKEFAAASLEAGLNCRPRSSRSPNSRQRASRTGRSGSSSISRTGRSSHTCIGSSRSSASPPARSCGTR